MCAGKLKFNLFCFTFNSNTILIHLYFINEGVNDFLTTRGQVRVDLLSQQVFEARVQFNVVFAQVAEQLVCPQDLGNSHQLESTTHTTNCASF